MFWNNTAHTGLVGLNVLGTSSPCTSIGGFTSAFHWTYGVFSSLASSLVVTNMAIASGKVGMNLNVYGPDPVQHLLGRKFVQVTNSLIVGNLPGEQCSSSAPSYAVVHIGPNEPKLGIMMSSFNQKRSKMDGTGVWHLSKPLPPGWVGVGVGRWVTSVRDFLMLCVGGSTLCIIRAIMCGCVW